MTRIVFLPGRVREHDRLGHHDYLAGARLLAGLLARQHGVTTQVCEDGWPHDPCAFDDAAALVFYEGGGGKQAVFQQPERSGVLSRSLERGAGLVMLHQGVGFPADGTEIGRAWLGGCYVPGTSSRGHWKTSHDRFPEHPVTRGVSPWRIEDGWLRDLVFVPDMTGITPLVWSGPIHAGSAAGGGADIAAWAYERRGGGRSFAFTGLDAHSAWSANGLRQLLVNAVTWVAGLDVPESGAPSELDEAAIAAYLTPRRSRAAGLLRKLVSGKTPKRRW